MSLYRSKETKEGKPQNDNQRRSSKLNYLSFVLGGMRSSTHHIGRSIREWASYLPVGYEPSKETVDLVEEAHLLQREIETRLRLLQNIQKELSEVSSEITASTKLTRK